MATAERPRKFDARLPTVDVEAEMLAVVKAAAAAASLSMADIVRDALSLYLRTMPDVKRPAVHGEAAGR